MYNERVDFGILKGKTLKKIDGGECSDELIFETIDGERFKMYHGQDCCERVSIEDICGRLEDLIDSTITEAYESVGGGGPKGNEDYKDESFTWTFYRISTAKGSVVIRWYGSSNGYYCERVDFKRI